MATLAKTDSGSNETLTFRPSARLQKFLGQELIADPNLAILEFVKNSYDAGATSVLLDFDLLPESERTSLTIADNGVGMDFSEFEENWMHPGFSKKADATPTRSRSGRNSAERLSNARTPVGEKGLGRLAAGRLGEIFEVFTRKHANTPWLHVKFEWKIFDDMSKAMDEVKIPYDYVPEAPQQALLTGTVVKISGLRQAWDGRLRGRPVAGRSRTKLGRLRQDLEYLLRPLDPTDDGFMIELRSNLIAEEDDIGVITPAAAIQQGDYVYTFEVGGNPRTNLVEIKRHVQRSEEAAKLLNKKRAERLKTVQVTDQISREERRPATLRCGSFEGCFVYTPPAAARRALEIESTPTGVVLYRDGVLVEPYGLDGNDWIGVSARKAQRQGHAAIQPNTFTGYVTIGRFSNPELRDMSNRSGLLDNEASEEFQEHIRAEFRVFESIVYEEVFEEFRWEDSRANKAGRRSLASAERAVVFLRSLAHSIRQPLFGLQMELSALGSLAKRADLSEEIKEVLRVAEQKSKQYLDRADEVIRQVLELQPPEFAEIQASDLIGRALHQVADLAKSKGTEIRVGKMVKNKKVLVPEALVVNALGALLFNALEAPHAEGVAEVVELDASTVDKDVCITIRDNGVGIESYNPAQGLGNIKSSKGRPAMGLSMAEMSIISAQGRLRLVSTGKEGTEFEVTLPSRVSGLRS